VKQLTQLWDYLTTADHWWGRRGLWYGITEHVRVSVLAVLIAVAVAVPIALVLGHVRRGGVAVNAAVNIGRAIPSFAIVVLLYPISQSYGFKLGFIPTLVALVLLAIPVAIVINGMRVFLTGFLVYFVSDAFGTGFMHVTEGWLLFLVSLATIGGIAVLAMALERRVRRGTASEVVADA